MYNNLTNCSSLVLSIYAATTTANAVIVDTTCRDSTHDINWYFFFLYAVTVNIIMGYKSNGRYNNNMCFIPSMNFLSTKICIGFDFHGLYIELSDNSFDICGIKLCNKNGGKMNGRKNTTERRRW